MAHHQSFKKKKRTSKLAIIPARSGSKGLPQKNILKIAGKPLIVHTIDAAKKAKIFDKIIVSTDSNKIAKIAKNNDIDVPFLRAKQFSKDSTTLLRVIKHVLSILKENYDYVPEIITILQPTTPFRNPKHLIQSVEKLKKNNTTSVLSVKKIKNHLFSSFWIKNNKLKPFHDNFEKFYQRQKYPALYSPTGSIYTFWLKTIQKYDSIYGPRISPLIIDNEKLNLDIDNKFDLLLAELISKHMKD